jgi:hypothetical protein
MSEIVVKPAEGIATASMLRFDLKSLLFAMTAVGILLAPASWFGLPYLVAVGFSTTLVCGCALAHRAAGRGLAFAAAICGLLGGLVLGLVLMVFAGHAFFNAILCFLLLPFHLRTRTYALALTVLAVAFYGFVLFQGAMRVQELLDLKANFPLQSLRERLAFEAKNTRAAATSATPVALASAVAARLDEQESYLEYRAGGYYSRPGALKRLHDDISREFIQASGFGVARMEAVYAGMVQLEPRKEFKLPRRVAVASPVPADADLISLNVKAALNFADLERTGYVRSRDAVAGFQAHGLDAASDIWPSSTPQTSDWQIKRLELVSLLRHAEPRAYIAETLPRMDQLTDVPHRAISEFEKQALVKLKDSEDVVVERELGRIRMLGALRASKHCLQCHEAKRGELLGAFFYELAPLATAAQDPSGN